MSELFSWKSPTARKLGLKPSGRSDDQLLDMMLREPALIRRPIIRKDGKIQLGFGKAGLTV